MFTWEVGTWELVSGKSGYHGVSKLGRGDIEARGFEESKVKG